MPSLIAGYEYDIFISYRHNDNLSGWVTEFVKNLQEELSATIKDPVSVYFDSNPHDGLLETHNVDKSLEGKLKCLIFIPILSQTYCDPKSFAWQNEFVAFNKFVRDDPFGKHIKLENGNVASRILPVQIHEIDRVDRSLLEKEFNAIIRPIEFIYKSSGVNRPLMPGDNPDKNLNKTFYRDQINKVANAIKEITIGIKGFDSTTTRENSRSRSHYQVPDKTSKKRTILFFVVAILILIGVSYAYQYRVADLSDENTDIEKSIAVLPFTDMSPGKDQEYLGDGIAEEIITALSRIQDLKVIGRTSSFQFKGDKVDLRDIGEKLHVATVLEGSIRKSGNNVRITAQLINVDDGSHIWSERYDRDMTNIFAIQDEISSHIAEKLKLTLFETAGVSTEILPTRNMDAYEMVLKGNYFLRQGPKDGEKATKFFQKAIDLDSTYADAYIGLAWGYFFSFKNNRGWLEKVRNTVNKALIHNLDEGRASELMLAVYLYEWNWTAAKREYDKWFAANHNGTVSHAVFLRMAYGDCRSSIEMLEAIVKNDPLNLEALRILASSFTHDRQYDEARRVHSNILEIDPAYSEAYVSIGWNYFLEGNYKLAYENYAKGKALLSEDDIWGPAHCLIITLAYDNRKSEALKEYQKFKEHYKDYNTFHAEVLFALGDANEAFRLLEIAYDQREPVLVYLRTDRIFDAYRSDKRFQAIMQKINFPEK